ncbi:glycosyltransferase family 4 protein [candidate division WOR-3 bacterium]|nr:glycosyltransferase family 4 protein [candidate division WOR-3 bacterium]
MRTWIIDIGDPLPYFHPEDRRFRAGNIADHLMEASHHVLWWGSTFDHARKRHEADRDSRVDVSPQLAYRVLHATSYSKNVSVARVVNHWLIGRKFRRYARTEARPDVIVCSFPTLDLSYEATRYGRERDVPVVLDIRDLWPHAMLKVVPAAVAPLGRLALGPYFWMARKACRRATCLMGITPAFVEWGAACAGRPVQALDRSFPLANEKWTPTDAEVDRARNRWHTRGLRDSDLILCLAGSLGLRQSLDLEPVIAAAKELRQTVPNCRVVLCGTGDSLDHYRRMAGECDNVMLPGWVDRTEIWTLLRMATFGLVPYQSTYSLARSYPIKVIEYLSAGLPILSSVNGLLAQLLQRTGCGITYPNGDYRALTRIVIDLATDQSRLEEMRRHCLQAFETEFHPDKVYGAMVKHLEFVQKFHDKRADRRPLRRPVDGVRQFGD